MSSQPAKDDSSDSKSSQSDQISSAKTKRRRGTQKKTEGSLNKLAQSEQLHPGKQKKAEDKIQSKSNKPGRKRKERQVANTRSTDGEVKKASSKGGDDLYNSEKHDASISSSVSGKKSPKQRSISTNDSTTEYDWRSVGSITEPENLGPCESGTQVCLEGIVWQETSNGVLIVNVTWRGKSYMGTLLDATKYDWSPPSCESPLSDLDGRTSKARGKRSRVPLCDTFKDINERKLRKEMRRQPAVESPAKPDNGKKQDRSLDSDTTESTAKRSCVTSINDNDSGSPTALIECPEPQCDKKYKHMNGLKYHLRNAHPESFTKNNDILFENETFESVPLVESTKNQNEKSELKTNDLAIPKNQITSKPETEVNLAIESVMNPASTEMSTNTTSEITSTILNSANSNISQSPLVPATVTQSVPVATITPQVIKSSSPAEDRDLLKTSSASVSSLDRSHKFPQKLLPKTNTNILAPLSAISTQGSFNSSLKPIQPKPMLLAEAPLKSSLMELHDVKSLKRRRSEGKDSSAISISTASVDQKCVPHIDEQKSNTAMFDMTLKSPSTYSDISDEGDRKGLSKAETLTNKSSDIVNPFLVAMVSPQQTNIKNDSVGEKKRQPECSKIPADGKRESDETIKQNLEFINQYQLQGWPMMPDFVHMLMSKDKPQIAVTPQPSSAKLFSGSPYEAEDSKSSSERLQCLAENMEMKLQTSHSLHGKKVRPADYSMSSSLQKFRENPSTYSIHPEQMQNQLRKDSKLPVHKTPAIGKASDFRPDFSKASLVSSMPPPFSSASSPYNMAGLTNNFMLGGHIPFLLPGMTELRDSPVRPSMHHLFSYKMENKLHEMEPAKTSQSPRPPHTPDRQNVAKTTVMNQQPLQPAFSSDKTASNTGGRVHQQIMTDLGAG